MFKIIKKAESLTDSVTKYILEDSEFGKNEVSVLRKDTKDVIVLPTQTNCKMGCKFCHLTGTSRVAKNLSSEWFSEVVNFIVSLESLNRDLLISFMGAGEPLLNIDNLINGIQFISANVKPVRFGIATMVPNNGIEKLTKWVVANPGTSVKLHLSVHGIDSRSEIVKSKIGIETAIGMIQKYSEDTHMPIEYHYTLVSGINDSMLELEKFKQLIDRGCQSDTVKFLTLSEVGDCRKSEVSNAELVSLFNGLTVEFYDPPGRDVGSSCGMFDKSLYMEAEC